MAKKRGLGRGIGALIPSSTSAPEAPAPTEAAAGGPDRAKQDTKDTSAAAAEEPLAENEGDTSGDASESARPVDMFFASESANSTATKTAARAKRDLADNWARDTQTKRRSGATKSSRTTAKTSTKKTSGAAQNKAVEATEASRTVASKSTASKASKTPAPQVVEEPQLVAVPGAEFAEVPIREIRENPRNPRTVFDEDELDELAYSLREVGVLQPIVVRPVKESHDGESFEIVMGERRWRAAKRAGLTSIPAIIRSTTDDDLLRDALLENLHRSQLNPLEEAAAYGQLLEDFNCTQDELADRIGRSRPQISNTLRLLRLPPLVQRRLQSGAISAGHARALLGLEDTQLQEELAQRIVNEGLSVRAVERLIANGVEASTAIRSVPRRSSYNPRVVSLTSQLSTRLEAPVRIDVGKRKGKITLEFTNLDDLERLVDRLGLELDQ